MQQYLHTNCHQQKKVMINRLYLPAILFLLAVSACRKDDMQTVSTDKLQKAILAGNPDEVETQINNVCTSSQMHVTNNSEESLNQLAESISNAFKVDAAVVCYNCIKTLPEESEIKISVDYQELKK